MARHLHGLVPVFVTLLLSTACTHQKEIAAVPVEAPPPPPPPAMPAGGRPGMTIPARLADGSFATPSRNLSDSGATWHLRAALNVAVLVCRDADEAWMAGRYNALLASRRTMLAGAQHALQAEFTEATYDSAMTRLYNFYAQDFARTGFCTAARGTLAQAETVDAAAFPAFARERLAQIDQPFTDFYAAYDAWRTGQTVTTIAAPAPSAAPPPRLTVDVAALN